MIYKFRAWNKNGKYMEEVDGYDLFLADGKVFEVTEESRNWQIWMERTDVTEKYDLMQFTGLYDMENTELYDGDILDAGDRIVLVVWNQPNGCWDCDYIKYKIRLSNLTSNGITPVEWKYRAKVIGNKYNNPELLA